MIARSYQALGSICLIKQKDKKRAQEILDKHKRFKSVYYSGKISGQLRKPNISWLAGEKNTLVKVRENGCDFIVDISKVMFSKGNQEEKRKVVSQIKTKEDVLDMFAGIGYFTIPIAKLTDAKVIAIEINPDSVELLKYNIKLNKLENKIIVIQGDSKVETLKLNKKFDRIHMGFFPGTYDFLPSALKVAKKGTIIHFHEVSEDSKDIEKRVFAIAVIENCEISIINKRKVKEYGARKWHWVLDIKFIK